MKKYHSNRLPAGRQGNLRILWVILAALGLSACGADEGREYYVLTGKQVQTAPEITLTLTVVRKFEKESWCRSEAERLRKHRLETECRAGDLNYEPYFKGVPAGKWYALQQMGRFPPLVLIYEATPPLPDSVMLQNVSASAPRILKFSALHRAPARVRVFSPTAELPWMAASS